MMSKIVLCILQCSLLAANFFGSTGLLWLKDFLEGLLEVKITPSHRINVYLLHILDFHGNYSSM